MYIETKHLVLAAVVSSIATFAWQRQVDADSALRWIDEAVNFFPMSDYVNFAGVDIAPSEDIRFASIMLGTAAFTGTGKPERFRKP